MSEEACLLVSTSNDDSTVPHVAASSLAASPQNRWCDLFSGIFLVVSKSEGDIEINNWGPCIQSSNLIGGEVTFRNNVGFQSSHEWKMEKKISAEIYGGLFRAANLR